MSLGAGGFWRSVLVGCGLDVDRNEKRVIFHFERQQVRTFRCVACLVYISDRAAVCAIQLMGKERSFSGVVPMITIPLSLVVGVMGCRWAHLRV